MLTQTPAVHTVSTGQEVVLKCNIQRDDSQYVSWYKQVPDEAPQYVLRFYHTHSSPSFSSGFSSDRFNSKSSSNIDYQFFPPLLFLMSSVGERPAYKRSLHFSALLNISSKFLTLENEREFCADAVFKPSAGIVAKNKSFIKITENSLALYLYQKVSLLTFERLCISWEHKHGPSPLGIVSICLHTLQIIMKIGEKL